MNIDELLKLREELFKKAQDICKSKGHDYSGETGDTFLNIRACEKLGLCTTEQGIMIRLIDKTARLIAFLRQGTFLVKDESLEDTIIDAINYLTYLYAIHKEKNKN